MKPWLQKAFAVLEVFLVAFVCVPLLTLSLYLLFPQLEDWQMVTLGFPFPVFTHVVMMSLSLLAILIRRRDPAEYGLTFTNPKYHLDIAATCFIPLVLANAPFGMGLDQTTWGGAFVLAGIQIVLLFALAWLLRKKPSAGSLSFMATGMLLMPRVTGVADSTAGKVLVLFLTYGFFVGFGEEILYRGYMQSRLNETFGKPYRFFGVAFGWGVVITALLFGFSHIGVLRWMLGLSTEVTIAWGFAAFFVGLVFGFVREKSGSILAPALLHGLPQAIATVAMLFL
jgi:membrane protease YdiL (CAAX protease family)